MANTTKPGTIYLAWVPESGKVYVGQTTQTIHRCYSLRFAKASRIGKASRNIWEKALHKYGAKGIKFIPLAENVPNDRLDELERLCIAQYKSNNPEFGYNRTSGGRDNEEAKKYFRDASENRGRNAKVWRFYHKDHGHQAITCRELQKRFSVGRDASSRLTRNDLCISYKGWVCLDAPIVKRERNKFAVFQHPEFGEFKGSAPTLVEYFPEQKLCSLNLNRVVKGYSGGGDPCLQHKGWRFVREASPEDEEACRINLANIGHDNSKPTRYHRWRKPSGIRKHDTFP